MAIKKDLYDPLYSQRFRVQLSSGSINRVVPPPQTVEQIVIDLPPIVKRGRGRPTKNWRREWRDW